MSLPSYIINFDELVDLIKDYLKNGINVDIGSLTFNTDDVERLLGEIKDKIQGVDYNDLIKALNALNVKLEGLGDNLGISGTQKIYGKMLRVPAVADIYTIECSAPGRLTGITYSQSNWNVEDSWDLVIGDKKLFDNVRTKEYGEYKHLNAFYPIDDTIKFIYNNKSGTSKVIWVDFGVLEG